MRTVQGCQVLAVLLLGALAVASAQDVSMVLAQYPQFSKFNELLNTTGVLVEVNMRNSMTILLPDDSLMNGYLGAHASYTTQMVADVVRYHCLLQYFGGEELLNINAQNGAVITTLYQTTGRANGLDGFVNITAQPDGTRSVSPSTPGAPVQANIITNVTQYPYNYSFLQVSGVLEPLGLAAAQLAPTTPPSVAPVPAPMAPVPAAAVPVPAPAVAPAVAPVVAPVPAPVVAPVPSPVSVPAAAPTPATVPAAAPTPATVPAPAPVAEAPAPVSTPPAPAATPELPPATTPTLAPGAVAPTPPVVNAPLSSPTNSGSSVRSSVPALLASAIVASLLL